ncbi:MAG: hypothetical protein HYZ83_01395 [Candidatus Omnitrophica bacterium]|nr:hypothetical protein [Candidatus Omnitrophota bacterium]
MTILFCGFSISAFAADFSGRILAAKTPETIPEISVPSKHQASCGASQLSQTLQVSPEGYLKNAVISLEGSPALTGGKFSLPSMNLLDQKDCRFSPHILLTAQGEPFKVANSDPMAHDVRGFRDAQMLFRFEMDEGSKPVEKIIPETGRFLIRCGLHQWMHAYVISAEHPYYAVSDEKGFFSIPGVPEGNYTVRIWHEILGEITQPINLTQSVSDFKYEYR